MVATNLAPYKDGTEAVEELEGRHDVALDQQACAQSSRHPPSRAHRHLVEPLLKRELADHATASERVGHGVGGMSEVFGKGSEIPQEGHAGAGLRSAAYGGRESSRRCYISHGRKNSWPWASS